MPVGENFSHSSRPALGPLQPPVQWVHGIFPGVKRPACGVDYPPQFNAEVKERLDYLSSPFGTSWPVLG